jgi:hypothetical protein
MKHAFAFQGWDNVAFFVGLSEELREDLDRLASSKKVIERHASDTSHLDVVHETHEFIEETLREVSVLS